MAFKAVSGVNKNVYSIPTHLIRHPLRKCLLLLIQKQDHFKMAKHWTIGGYINI